MTHQIYTLQKLQELKLDQIKTIAQQLGVTPESDKRSRNSWINSIVEHQNSQVIELSVSGGFRQIENEQAVAQAELETHIEQQAEVVAPEVQRLKDNQQGYRDAVAGLEMQQPTNHCYRMGYDRGLRDVSPLPQEADTESAIVFDKVGETIYGGKWEANINGVIVRIMSVRGGYKTNLTGDRLLVDFAITVKETLLAVARLAPKQDPSLEIFATNQPNVYAVYSHKPNNKDRYEVNLENSSCTCPHYKHRHEQEGFRDKHIEAVRLALQIRTTPLPLETEMLLDQPFDELTLEDWQRIGQHYRELVAPPVTCGGDTTEGGFPSVGKCRWKPAKSAGSAA